MSINRYVTALVFIILIFSCKTLRPPVHVTKHYTINNIYDSIISIEPDVKTFSSRRVSINIEDEDINLNLRGFVRMQRDSIILISINAFAGIEAGRILITRDSIKIIDRLNNNFFIGDHENANRIVPFPVDFTILQGLFLGSTSRFFYDNALGKNGEHVYSFEEDKISILSEYKLSEGNSGNLQLTYDRSFRINRVQFYSEANQQYVDLTFNSFLRLDEKYFPEVVKLSYVSSVGNMNIEIRIGRIDINDDLTFPFNIPSRYSPM